MHSFRPSEATSGLARVALRRSGVDWQSRIDPNPGFADARGVLDVAPYALAILATFVVNLPFGYWRASMRKFSPAWFVAIHAPVPLVIGLRFALGLPFRWSAVPLFVAAYFAGQFVGSRWRLRRLAAGAPTHPAD